jgi:hypothetical protein
MLTEAELNEFLFEYEAVNSDLLQSTSATFDSNLERWFELLEERPAISSFIHQIEATRDEFEGWFAERESTMTSWVGSGELRWPAGRENRVAMQVALFRAFQRGKPSILDFDRTFFGTDGRFTDMVNAVTTQVFGPMTRDLRRLMERFARTEQPLSVPASDRTVTLGRICGRGGPR